MTQANVLAQLGAQSGPTFRNRIINGAMVISQYNGSSAVNPISSGYPIDRFYYYGSQASKLSFQQNAGSVTPPVGFSNYAGFTSLSAYSINSTDQFLFQQPIEGFNTADLAWGTANAKTVTLSAWVYSSLTGNFGGAIQNSASNRCYPFSYAISSANTWTQISITIAGDTTGTWIGATNGTGMKVIFSLGSGTAQSSTAGAWTGTSFQTSSTGATSVVGTSGATFYITGVQLEVGSSATGFEYRIYGTEFANCQRYYNKILLGDTATSSTVGIMAFNYLSTLALGYLVYPVAMRTSASVITTGSTSNYSVLQYGGSVGLASVPVGTNVSNTITQINYPTAGGLNVGQGCALRGNTSSNNDWIALSAEL